MHTLACETANKYYIFCAQVPAATSHAVLLPHDWRNILDASFGLLHGVWTGSSKEQALLQSMAAYRRLTETNTLAAGKMLMRTYLFGPREAVQTDGGPGPQRAGRDHTRGIVRPISVVERLQRLDLAAAPLVVKAVYALFMTEAAAEDAELHGWLAESLADCMIPHDVTMSPNSSTEGSQDIRPGGLLPSDTAPQARAASSD